MSGSDWLTGIKVLFEMLNHPVFYIGIAFIILFNLFVAPFIQDKFFRRDEQEAEEE